MSEKPDGAAEREPLVIGEYQVVTRVHRGSLASVYRCRDLAAERIVAVKLADAVAGLRRMADERLDREKKIRGQLDHVHLLPLYHSGHTERGSFVVGPWLGGGTLHDRGGHLSAAEVVSLAAGVGRGLDALAAAGWVHCDLNAANLCYAVDGRVVIADFASARRVGSRWNSAGGEEAMEVSPHVVAPEAWAGRAVDGRSDLYALAVLLYRELVGSLPFHAEDVDGYAELHLRAAVPLPSVRSPALGSAIDDLMLKALHKDPDRRFPSGAQLALALQQALGVAAPIAAVDEASGLTPTAAADFGSALRAAGAQLERFAATLDDGELAALQELLGQARRSDARAQVEVAALTTQVFGPPAVLLALEAAGATWALADGPLSAADVAHACSAPVETIGRLLEVAAAAGYLQLKNRCFALPPPLSRLYLTQRQLGWKEGPIRDAASFWARLPSWAVTGKPASEMDRADGAVYSWSADVLGAAETELAQRLAQWLRSANRVPQAARVLDVGAGSGVWSLALLAGDPQCSVTALDRPAVLDVLRAHARQAGVADRVQPIAADWCDAELPASAFDVALLANVCHLESAAGARQLVNKTAQALRPGARLIVIDTIPDADEERRLPALLYGLRLALRTPHGGSHSLDDYREWLREAGMELEEVWKPGGEVVVTVLVARRAVASPLTEALTP